MMAQEETTSSRLAATERRSLLRRVLTALFIVGALYATALSFLWFAADFIAASIYSPNLDQTQQVSDFNDFAHIGKMLAGYRFSYGALALVMSIALLALAVLINDPLATPRRVFIAGVVALGSQALLLAQGFHWGFALLFVATAATLYLATEWLLPTADTAAVMPADAVAEADAEAEADWPPKPVLPDAPEVEVEARDAAPQEEAASTLASAPEAEPESEPEPEVEETVAPAPEEAEPLPLVANEDGEEVDTRAVESLGLEIESDLNLDLEQDYQLAHDSATEEDPLLLLSQEDLGIVDDDDEAVDDDTIETAARIEAEVSRELPLEQANTEQIKAMIEMADDDPIGVVAKELTPAPEDVPPETPAPVVAPDFDPRELARQESLLPPPRKRVWNMLDWVIVSIVVVALLALLLLNL